MKDSSKKAEMEKFWKGDETKTTIEKGVAEKVKEEMDNSVKKIAEEIRKKSS